MPFRSATALLGLGAFICFSALGILGASVNSATAETVSWREEVALHDGGRIIASWQVRMVAGQPFQSMVGEERVTFTLPGGGQPIVWKHPGNCCSRLGLILLAVDGQRLFLVGIPKSGADYDGFGCPTPPYVVLRHEAGNWVRMALSDLPRRFSTSNLLGYAGRDLIRESKGYLTAAQIATWFDGVRRDSTRARYATIDRRIRNPLSLDCSRDALERTYGAGKYEEWNGTGTWRSSPNAAG